MNKVPLNGKELRLTFALLACIVCLLAAYTLLGLTAESAACPIHSPSVAGSHDAPIVQSVYLTPIERPTRPNYDLVTHGNTVTIRVTEVSADDYRPSS